MISTKSTQTVNIDVSSSRTHPIPVLMAVRELHHGGIERDVTKIALHIDRERFQPHVASYRLEGMRFDELKSSNIPVLHLPVSSLKSPTTLLTALRMRRYIRKHGIRLVHAYDPSAVFVVPAARAMRVPAVLSSTLGHRDLFSQRTQRQLRWTDTMVDAVVVNCEAMRRHMVSDEHVEANKIELCYNGVDTSVFFPTAVPKRLPIANASFVIGTVCVLRPEKSLDLLQEAFARVRHLKPGMKLLLVGSGPELARLRSNSIRLGLHDSCLFIPATPFVSEILPALDIFVLCSRSEAFSNTLLEAMACGCCAAGSHVGGTPELLGNSERGLLFRPNDVEDLADKLAMLILNDCLRQQLGAKATQFAATLNVQRAAQCMGDIYERILRRKAVFVQ